MVFVAVNDTILARTVAGSLERAGFAVELAVDGHAGINRFQRGGLVGVVVECNLTNGLAGLAVVCEIRGRDGLIPIIVVGGRRATGDKVKALTAGADDCLSEPLDSDELVARLEVGIRRRRMLLTNKSSQAPILLTALPRMVRLGHVTLDLRTGHYFGPQGRRGRLGRALHELVQYLVQARGRPRDREEMVRDLRPVVSTGAMGERVRALRNVLRAAGEPEPETVLQYRDEGTARGYALDWSNAKGTKADDPGKARRK